RHLWLLCRPAAVRAREQSLLSNSIARLRIIPAQSRLLASMAAHSNPHSRVLVFPPVTTSCFFACGMRGAGYLKPTHHFTRCLKLIITRLMANSLPQAHLSCFSLTRISVLVELRSLGRDDTIRLTNR